MDGDIGNKPAMILLCDDVVNALLSAEQFAVPLNVCEVLPLGVEKNVLTRASLLLPTNESRKVPLLSLDRQHTIISIPIC